MEKLTYALDKFDEGLNCAQSLLSTFAEDLKVDEEELIKVSSAFGGGMARMQLTCGAVTGAYMAIGFKHSGKRKDRAEDKLMLNQKVHEFNVLFRQKHKTLSCKELTGCDFSTEEGNEKFNHENVKNKVCAVCIGDAIAIVESL